MLRPGTQIGSYEIVSAIGAGGQSEVYRARDTQRGIEVVLRPLPEPLAGKPDAVERIEHDSRLLETLNHPNISSLHAVEAEGTQFLVNDLVGETLAERLRRGPFSVGDALTAALGIARALEAAHEKGVLHRDLNPSNIRVAPDGKASVLDFGLASVFADEAAASNIDPSLSPTMSATLTRSGIFSGTAAYLSPEQVRGEAGDAGSDVWALGCILYEMLAGRAAFFGQSESEVRAEILKSEPDWSRLPAHLQPRIRFLLERCLDKRTASRSSDMAGVRADIEKTLEDPADASTAATGARKRSVLPWVAAIVLAGILGVGGSWALRSDAPSPVVRFGMWASRAGGITQALQAVSPELEISPDGQRIAFRGVDGGLYLRDRGDITPRPVRITQETGTLYSPLFSADGRDLYYVDIPLNQSLNPAVIRVIPREMVIGQLPAPGLNLNRVPVSGGAPTPVLTGRNEELLDATWSANDTILFVDSKGKIQSVSANGGTPATLFEASGARYPQLLPDGKRVLYSTGEFVAPALTGGAVPAGQIVIQSLADPEDRRVVWEGGTHARYIEATGHIVYQGLTHPGLWAFTFDLSSLERTGDPVPLVEDTIVDYALSDTGSLAYAVGVGLSLVTTSDAGSGTSVLGMVSPNGAVTRRLRVDPGRYRNPRVSPDGKRVAYEAVSASGESDVWVYDLEGDFPKRLTPGGSNIYPIWKDDTHVTFASKRDEVWGVYTQPTDPGATVDLVVAAPQGAVYQPHAWSPPGSGETDRVLVLVTAAESAETRTRHLAMWASGSEVTEIPPAEPGSSEFGASLSPDGAWLAYIASCEAYLGCARVQRFPPVPGSSIQIRLNDGWVQFSPDGRQLLTSRTNALFAWNVNSAGGRFDFAGPRAIPLQGFSVARDNRNFDLRGPIGQEAVMVIPANQAVSAQGEQNPVTSISSRIDFVHNFFEVLRERVHPSGDK